MSRRHMYAASQEDVAEAVIRKVDAEREETELQKARGRRTGAERGKADGQRRRTVSAPERRRAEAAEDRRDEERNRREEAQARRTEDPEMMYEDRPSEQELRSTGVGRFSLADINRAQRTARAWCRKHTGDG